MTASEIVMKRDDPNIAWGFRLTGGADLGTPFYVVKVLGRGHAERAGLRVGDMVYAINHKYINKYSHKDAQNEILHTGDTLILNIKRGPTSGRGTPLPDYTDPLMGLAPPPEIMRPKPIPLPPYEPPPPFIKEPTPPESDEEAEDTVAAFTVKINPKGRIAAIEELPVTPPPSRTSSRSRSRSRSASRDRRRSSTKRESNQQQSVENGYDGMTGQANGYGGISGPGEAFTYSKEVVTQYSTVLSASSQSKGQVSEMINESFIIHGGSEQKMEDVLSHEDIERDIFEEKMEEQRLKELLTGEAEVLDKGVVGINFEKIIPRTDFIKESNVFKELQEQRLKKEEPEEEQLKKDPNKRFSTFLQTPKRPVPKPKQTTPPQEDLPWKQQPETPQTQSTRTESVNIEEVFVRETSEQHLYSERMLSVPEEGGPIITEAVSIENISDEKVRFRDEAEEKDENTCSIEEYKEQISTEEQLSETTHTEQEYQKEESTTIEYKSDFERQLAEIQKQIESISQLSSVLQANLGGIQGQIAQIIQAKETAEQKEETEDTLNNNSDGNQPQFNRQIDESFKETKEECVEESLHVEAESQEKYVTELTAESENEGTIHIYNNESGPEDAEVANTMKHNVYEQYENMKNLNMYRRDDDELSVSKPHEIRNFPKTAERPIVLPGGRKWYKPRDAYNEGFIAETIIHQSEVLVGTTIGLNFLKYEPPKFDAKNSAVFRLIQEMEHRRHGDSNGLPIESRPEKVLAEEDYNPPISKRHFFAACLSEQTTVPEHVEKILHETNEHNIVSV